MIRKPPAGNRNLKILLGATLAVAVILTLILLFVPEKKGRSAELPGTLLYTDGESKVCTLNLQGTISTYAFHKDESVFKGTLQVDGQEVGEVHLTFDGEYYTAGTDDAIPAVMTDDLEIIAQVQLDGRDCLVLAPAPDEEFAQSLLARFLSTCAYARRQGWGTYQN